MGHGSRVAGVVLCLGSAAAVLAGEAPRRQWKVGEFTWVKRQAAEAGAPPNEHPARIQVEALRQQLGAIRFKTETASEALFAQEELAQLLEPLREALSVAGPGDDLVLLSTHRRGGSFLNTAFGVTARIFIQGGNLNLIVREARLDFVDRYRATMALPEFQFGSRTAAGGVELKHPGAASRRPDWLAFPLEGLTAAPAAQIAPALAPAAVPAPAPAPKARDAAFFEEQEKRLRALKHMRDENLITEEEYQQKRGEVLKNL